MMTQRWLGFVCVSAIGVVACTACEMNANVATEDGGPRRDGGGTDAGDVVCDIECVAPPDGCHYEVPPGACTCGTLVCADAGVGCEQPIDCAPPPSGCSYVGGDGCTSCGTLRCADDVMCTSTGTPGVFPTFARECTQTADCILVEHQANCCGTMQALGMRGDQLAAFQAAEMTCREMYPGCGCAALETEADDGTTGNFLDGRVECVFGQCTSTFGLPAGTACDPSGESGPCGAGLSCCYPCGVPGCQNQCIANQCDPSSPSCDPCPAFP